MARKKSVEKKKKKWVKPELTIERSFMEPCKGCEIRYLNDQMTKAFWNVKKKQTEYPILYKRLENYMQLNGFKYTAGYTITPAYFTNEVENLCHGCKCSVSVHMRITNPTKKVRQRYFTRGNVWEP